MHVEIVTVVPCLKKLTYHAEPPDSWPGHREAIVSSHVELLTRVILSCAEYAGNCSLPAASDTDNEERRTVQVLHFPGSKIADASVKPANLVVLGDHGDRPSLQRFLRLVTPLR